MITYRIHKLSDEYDFDNVIFYQDKKDIGEGYVGKGSKLICFPRCPSCKKENYAPMVSTGLCASCDFNPNK